MLIAFEMPAYRLEDFAEHSGGQAFGLRIIAAAVVANEQRAPARKQVLSAVDEGMHPARHALCHEHRVVRDRPQRERLPSKPELSATQSREKPSSSPRPVRRAEGVRILSEGGRAVTRARFEKLVEHAIGSLDRPMSDGDLEAKFRGLAEGKKRDPGP